MVRHKRPLPSNERCNIGRSLAKGTMNDHLIQRGGAIYPRGCALVKAMPLFLMLFSIPECIQSRLPHPRIFDSVDSALTARKRGTGIVYIVSDGSLSSLQATADMAAASMKTMREHYPDLPIALITHGNSRLDLNGMLGFLSYHVHLTSTQSARSFRNESLCSPTHGESGVRCGVRVRLYSASPFQETIVVRSDVFACGNGVRDMLVTAKKAQLEIAMNTHEHSELALPDDSVILIRFSRPASGDCHVVRFLLWWASQTFKSDDDTTSLMRIMRTSSIYSQFRLRIGRLAATMAMQPFPANGEKREALKCSHTLVVRSAVTFYRGAPILMGAKSTRDWCAFINAPPGRPRAIAFNSTIQYGGRHDLASRIDARSTWPDMHARVVHSRNECDAFLAPGTCRGSDWTDTPLVEPVAGLRFPIRANWTFLHIPKTGGTSIESAAARLGILTPIAVFRTLYCTPDEALCTYPPTMCAGKAAPWHFPPDVLRRCGNIPDVYAVARVYCVIRHPVLRFVSEYNWRKANPAFRMHGMDINSFAVQELTRFQQATRAHLGTPRLPLNDAVLHVIPQSWFLFDEAGKCQCHYQLRLEQLDTDWSTFVRRVWQSKNNGNHMNMVLPKMNAMQAPVSGVTIDAQISRAIRKHQMENTTVHMVWRAYAEDFERLGYSSLHPHLRTSL